MTIFILILQFTIRVGNRLFSEINFSQKSFYAEWWFNWDSAEASFDPSLTFSPSSHINEKYSAIFEPNPSLRTN